MIGVSYRCEECNRERDLANHWLELRHTPSGAPYFREWTFEAELQEAKHVCSEKCAHVILSKHLSVLREKARDDKPKSTPEWTMGHSGDE